SRATCAPLTHLSPDARRYPTLSQVAHGFGELSARCRSSVAHAGASHSAFIKLSPFTPSSNLSPELNFLPVRTGPRFPPRDDPLMTPFRFLAVAVGLALFVGTATAQTTYRWNTTTGNWNTAANWLDGFDNPAVPPSAATTQLVFNASGTTSYT